MSDSSAPSEIHILEFNHGFKKAVKVAIAQFSIDVDKTLNIQKAVRYIESAASLGADFVVLPECFNTPYGGKYFLNPSLPEEIPEGPTSAALSAAALDNNVWVFGGSIPESDRGKVFNTCPVFNRSGELVARFRKMHLFDVDIPGKIRFKESEFFSPGNEPVIAETEFGRVGVGICYDLRFAEPALYYASQGCFMLIYPAAFSETTGQMHWDILTRTRALDCQLFVVGAASCPTDQYNSWGHSQICDPLYKFTSGGGTTASRVGFSNSPTSQSEYPSAPAETLRFV